LTILKAPENLYVAYKSFVILYMYTDLNVKESLRKGHFKSGLWIIYRTS